MVLEPLGQGFWTTLKLMRQVKDDLGASKERLGSMLGRFGAVFGRLGRILAPSWGHLGVSWGGVGGILEGLWVKFMDIFDALWRNTCCKPFLAYFFVFFGMLSFCETLVFVAPVEVFEGFFNIRFLGYKYCKPLKRS